MGFWHISGGWTAEAVAVALALTESLGGTPQPLPDSHSGTAVAPPDRFAPIAPRKVVIDLALANTAGEIRRDPDGLFYIIASVNEARVRFLIDTGATAIVLTQADAGRAGVLPPALEFHDSAETAGGRTAMARVKLARLVVGPVEQRDVGCGGWQRPGRVTARAELADAAPIRDDQRRPYGAAIKSGPGFLRGRSCA